MIFPAGVNQCLQESIAVTALLLAKTRWWMQIVTILSSLFCLIKRIFAAWLRSGLLTFWTFDIWIIGALLYTVGLSFKFKIFGIAVVGVWLKHGSKVKVPRESHATISLTQQCDTLYPCYTNSFLFDIALL